MTEKLTANIIAENMMSQFDSEGHNHHVLTEMTDYKNYDSAISKVGGFIKSISGNLHRKRTIRGWKLLVEWKYGSVDWVPLKDLKQSKPVELVEYSVANEICDEPAFNCWVKDTLRHMDRIISKVKSKYWHTSHKFGIRVLKIVKKAYDIYRQSGTELWTKAIAKQITNFRIAFEKLDGITPDEMRKGKIKPGYDHVNVHMVFDIKMDGKFTIKARLVADGHTTAPP